LVDAQIHVISRLVAFSWVSAGVVDHNTLEVDGHRPVRQFVSLDYFIGKVGDVDASIALPTHVEIVLLEVGEFVEELNQRLVVIDGHRPVSVVQPILRSTEAHSSGRLDVQEIGLEVPCVGVAQQVGSAFLED
jgi:hypothetical protein